VNVAAFNTLARQEASAWARSPLAKVWRTGLVLLDPVLTAAPSGGLPSTADQSALADGALVFEGPPPSGRPAGLVTWSDGSTMKVAVLSATRAFDALTRGGSFRRATARSFPPRSFARSAPDSPPRRTRTCRSPGGR
jgi:hypothetical protein